MDNEGSSTCRNDENAWGPTWNDKSGGNCAFDDPGVYSAMGGQYRTGTSKGSSSLAGVAGFGFAAGFTTATRTRTPESSSKCTCAKRGLWVPVPVPLPVPVPNK